MHCQPRSGVEGEAPRALPVEGATPAPSKAERLIVTNFDQALWAYPVLEWQRVEEKVASLPQFRREVKALQRFFIAAATECPLDPNGRIIIPPTLREYAGLKKRTVVLGVTRRIEIWAAERWKEVSEEAERSLAEMPDALAELEI